MTKSAFEHLWSVPIYLPDWLPPLTKRAVTAAEKRLGVRLPESYLDALRIQNGGYLRRRYHASGTSVRSIDGISHNRPFRDWSEEKEVMAESGIDTIPDIDGLIPISGDGHEYVCFDYRSSGPHGEPGISRVDVESFTGTTAIADNFADLIAGLKPDDHLHLGFITSDGLGTAQRRLAKALDVTFTNEGDDLYGYTVYRAQIGPDPGKQRRGKKSGGWLWLSSNLVDRGFVRKGDRKLYGDRLTLVTGQALRFPYNPTCTVTMTISRDTQASDLIEQYSDRLPYPHEPLIC